MLCLCEDQRLTNTVEIEAVRLLLFSTLLGSSLCCANSTNGEKNSGGVKTCSDRMHEQQLPWLWTFWSKWDRSKSRITPKYKDVPKFTPLNFGKVCWSFYLAKPPFVAPKNFVDLKFRNDRPHTSLTFPKNRSVSEYMQTIALRPCSWRMSA